MTQQMRDSQAGFTLIEALVAMVILGLGAVSLLTAAEGHVGRITDVSQRTAARWVAQNALVETQLGLPADATAVQMYGTGFTVSRQAELTEDPDLSSVEIRVADDRGARTLFILNGYVATEELQ